MLILKNWVLSAPDRSDRLLGYDGEKLARTLSVSVDDPERWQYKFELRFSDGKVNILDAMLHGNVISCVLKESYLSAAGPCELQVRGLSGEREIKSNVLGLMLADSINAGREFSAPSEFEQLEQNLTNLKEQAFVAAGQAHGSAERAETARENAEISATRAEAAMDKAEHFSKNAPEIRNGNWWVYNSASDQYEDSGQRAKGDKGETGAQGLQGVQGEKGEPGIPGAKGAQGAQGVQGIPGPKGDKGERGERGAQGEPGKGLVILGRYKSLDALKASVASPLPGDAYSIGAAVPYDIYIYDKVSGHWMNQGKLQGAKGDRGDKGDKGVPGTPGKDGAKGAKGDPGQDGAPGAKGDKGEPGEQGPAGVKGDKGDPGAQGTPGKDGAKGEPGKSAYQAALDGGFIGEEDAFNTSLGTVGRKITAPEAAADGQVLTYRTGKWTAEIPKASDVSSFNSRTGAIMPQDGDYTAYQVGARPATWTPTAAEVGAIPAVDGAQGQLLGFTSANVIGAVDAPKSKSKRCARFVIGTSTSGWTAADVDYLCDGTDDQIEINAAIRALPATGGEILILDGTYIITANIVVDKAHTKLRGNGSATMLKAMANSLKTIDVTAEYCTIADLMCSRDRGLALDARGITCSSNSIITGTICNGNSYGITCIGSNNLIIGNVCNHNVSYAIFCQAGGNSNVITGNTCNSNRYGINCSSSNSTITGNICSTNNNNGIFSKNNNNTIADNICNDNGVDGISCDSSNNTITGNVCIRGIGQSGDYTSSQQTITISGPDNLVTGNNCKGKPPLNRSTGNILANNKY